MPLLRLISLSKLSMMTGNANTNSGCRASMYRLPYMDLSQNWPRRGPQDSRTKITFLAEPKRAWRTGSRAERSCASCSHHSGALVHQGGLAALQPQVAERAACSATSPR